MVRAPSLRSYLHASLCLALLGGCSWGAPPAPPSPVGAATPAIVVTGRDQHGAALALTVAGRADAPAGASPEAAVRAHLAVLDRSLGPIPDHVRNAVLVATHRTRGGAVIARLRPEIDGIELHASEIRMLMRPDLSLVAVTGPVTARAELGPQGTRFALPAGAALAHALRAHFGTNVALDAVVETGEHNGPFVHLQLAPGADLVVHDARAKRVLADDGGARVPAYFVEFFAQRSNELGSSAHRYLVAADDGRVLDQRSLRAYDSFTYRVYADPTGEQRPRDNPFADFSPRPDDDPLSWNSDFEDSVLVEVEGRNTNPLGTADPWLPPGATETRGNHVDVYLNHDGVPDVPEPRQRAIVSAPFVFDYVYDPSRSPTADLTQSMAGMTNAFYILNWLHDWYYDSGFDEAAGNAQHDNYGRGGLAGDAIRVEAQFGGSTYPFNNAFIDVPFDGASPRLHVGIYRRPAPILRATPPGIELEVSSAIAGPEDDDLTGDLAAAADAVDPFGDACTTLVNAGDLAGKIVLVDRGRCSYEDQLLEVQSAGAIGMIIADDEVHHEPPTLLLYAEIPVVAVTLEQGRILRDALAEGPVTVTLERREGPIDAAFDATVMAHEWGHYLHSRLLDCRSTTCRALGEGWADFVAMHLSLREGDDLSGIYTVGAYVNRSAPAGWYFGLRRVPYSVDTRYNALTFRHMSDGEPLPSAHPVRRVDSFFGTSPNSAPHNAGEIWATMLWESYAELLRAHPYAEARRRMSDYVVSSLMMTPPQVTVTGARDALITAAYAVDPEDAKRIAEAFARRGAGSCAIAPPADSEDLTGVVESFTVAPSVEIVEARLEADAVVSCDDDGVLDAGETGRLVVRVANRGFVPLEGASLTVASDTPGIEFPAGATVALPALEPVSVATVSVDVRLDAAATTPMLGELTLTLTAPGACMPTAPQPVRAWLHRDEVSAASATDAFDATASVWTPAGTHADRIWRREAIDAGNLVWHGPAFPVVTDTQLVSPELHVSATAPFVIRLRHRHELDVGQFLAYDGAVIEVSADDGATWTDVLEYTAWDPYPGLITSLDNPNPLAGRFAFTRQNESWPEMDEVFVDLGTALAGRTVRVRFRLGTDQRARWAGWYLDEVGFQGIDNTPFPALVPETEVCTAPAADAGMSGDAGMASGSGGCACRVRPSQRQTPTGVWLALVAVTWLARRRRRS